MNHIWDIIANEDKKRQIIDNIRRKEQKINEKTTHNPTIAHIGI